MGEVEALVRDDMRTLSDTRVVAHVSSLLVVPPRQFRLGWTFGAVEWALAPGGGSPDAEPGAARDP